MSDQSRALATEIDQSLQLISRFLAQSNPIDYFHASRQNNEGTTRLPPTEQLCDRIEPFPLFEALQNADPKPTPSRSPSKPELVPQPKRGDAESSVFLKAQETKRSPFDKGSTINDPPAISSSPQSGVANGVDFAAIAKWMQRRYPQIPLRTFNVTPKAQPSQQQVILFFEEPGPKTAETGKSTKFLHQVIAGLNQQGISTQLIQVQQLDTLKITPAQLFLTSLELEKPLKDHLEAHQMMNGIVPVDWEAISSSQKFKRALWLTIKNHIAVRS